MKRKRGNTLALVLVSVGIVLLLIAFFALNYNQLMGGQKQVQSAIDTAALAAVIDISRVVVDTPLGRVALVDDSPAVASSAPSSGTLASPLKSDSHPIQGINSIMGTLRLDAVIANKLGNNSIAFLISQDIARAQEAAATLTASINSAAQGKGAVYDKFGNQINLFVANDSAGLGDVQKAYNANKSTLSRNASGLVNIELGYVNTNVGYTNIPLPSSEQSGSTQYYLPYKTYQVTPLFSGKNITPHFSGNSTMPPTIAGNFQFAAVATQAALIDKSSWYGPIASGSPGGSYAPATAVHVYVSQSVSPIAKVASSATLRSESFAQAGGGAATLSYAPPSSIFANIFSSQAAYAQNSAGGLLTPSGTLEISFASGGIPGLSAGGQQTAPNNQKLQMSNPQGGTTTNSTAGLFNNVMTIMNASMADAQTGSVGSDAPWAQTANPGGLTAHDTMASAGNWFVTEGGTVPGPTGSLSAATSFKSLNTTSNDNPSVALSFIVYDWLKTLGVRPNVQSVYDALTLSDKALPASTFYGFEALLTGNNAMSSPVNYTIANNGPSQPGLAWNLAEHNGSAASDNWLPPAYASTTGGAPGIVNGLEQFGFGDGAKDPRNLGKMSKEDIQRQQENVWGYVPADATISSNALLVKMSDGTPQTVDGNSLGDLYQLWGALAVSAKVAQTTKTNAGQIINGIMADLAKQNQQYQNLLQQKMALQKQLQASPNDQDLKSQVATLGNQMNDIIKGNLPQALKQAPRAGAALINAQYCMRVTGSIYSNFKTLTGIGCQRLSNTHYVLAGSDFWPTYQIATVAQLKGTSPVSTGQDPSLSISDWTAAPTDKNGSQLSFYKHAGAPVVGHVRGQGNSWLPPALALTGSAQNPYDKLHFCFYVSGSNAGQGQVHLYVGADPFVSTSGNAMGTLQGQVLYQDVQALQTNPTVTTTPPTAQDIINAVMTTYSRQISVPTYSTATYTAWQVQARDQAANNYTSATANDTTSNPAAAYFAEMNNNGGAASEGNAGWCGTNTGAIGSWQTPQCPALAAEWQLTCPMPASYNWTTYTQYTLPPISYTELIDVCDGEAGGTSIIAGETASFSVAGIAFNVVNEAFSPSFMWGLNSVGSWNGQQTVVGSYHS